MMMERGRCLILFLIYMSHIYSLKYSVRYLNTILVSIYYVSLQQCVSGILINHWQNNKFKLCGTNDIFPSRKAFVNLVASLEPSAFSHTVISHIWIFKECDDFFINDKNKIWHIFLAWCMYFFKISGIFF